MIAELCVASVCCLAAGAWARAPSGERRPDIVLVIADDQTWSDSGAYGNTEVRTPNIDRLASQGMRFARAFTATAMCAPTRQQLYTGIFPVRNGAYPNHSRVHDGTKSIVHHLRALGYRVGLAGKKHFGPAASFPFEKVDKTDLGAFLAKDAAQPRCLVYASNSPHMPWNAGDASVYDAGELTVPAWIADTPETRAALVRYYAEVTDFDRELGEVMAAVERTGRADDTIFIYTSEQGAQFPRAKWTCYDTGLHVGFIVRWPRRVEAGAVANAMVQYVDVVPTLIDAIGGVVADGLDGRSFWPVLRGETDTHHDAVFGVHTTRGIIAGSESYPIRSLRTGSHKLIWNLQHDATFRNVTIKQDRGKYWESWKRAAATDPRAARFVRGYQTRPEFELYDIRADPLELDNLADRPELAPLRRELLARLQAWMRAQGDQGIPTELAAGTRKKNKRREE